MDGIFTTTELVGDIFDDIEDKKLLGIAISLIAAERDGDTETADSLRKLLPPDFYIAAVRDDLKLLEEVLSSLVEDGLIERVSKN
jgi:hypothetical protein